MKVIDFFKEIAKIPRETEKESKIADYLCEFAQKRNLEYERDEYNNVVIKKNTSNGEPVILQAHTDMVCEKDAGKDFDFSKDPIEVIEKDGYLMANGTTLGADNGIGVAQILSILDSNLKCNIEAVFTVAEETTMEGAFRLDTSKLKGKLLLNLDGFEENTIIIESAAFSDIIMKLKHQWSQPKNQYQYHILLKGLKGGHSGFDIDKNRGNSSMILAEILNEIEEIEIVSFIGGTKFNVIPSDAEAIIRTNLTEGELKEVICKKIEEIGINELFVEIEEYHAEKSNSDILLKNITRKNSVLDKRQSKQFLNSIINFPHGVWKINENNEITTSVNLGVVDLKQNILKIGMRSSRKIEEEDTIKQLNKYAKENEMKMEIIGHQPGFETLKNDRIIRLLEKAFYLVQENKNEKLKMKAVHITVEIGILKEKMPEIQVAIISPNIQGAHTTRERVEIESIIKTTKWIEEFIKLQNIC